MVDELRDKDRKNALASKWKEHSTFPVLERKGGPSAVQMGESRLLYVRTVEKHNNEAFSYRLTKRILLSTDMRRSPSLSREEKRLVILPSV